MGWVRGWVREQEGRAGWADRLVMLVRRLGTGSRCMLSVLMHTDAH